MLLALDFKSQLLAYLEVEQRKNEIIDGIRFGEAGKKRATEILDTAGALAEKVTAGQFSSNISIKEEIRNQLKSYPAEGLAEFFSRSGVMKNLFNYSLKFHELAFLKEIPTPETLPPELKSISARLVDHLNLDRKKIL